MGRGLGYRVKAEGEGCTGWERRKGDGGSYTTDRE